MTDHEDLIRRLNSPMRNYAGASDLFSEASTAIKELVAERDNWREDARLRAVNSGYWRTRAEKAEADLAAAREALLDAHYMPRVCDGWWHDKHATAIAAARAEGGKND